MRDLILTIFIVLDPVPTRTWTCESYMNQWKTLSKIRQTAQVKQQVLENACKIVDVIITLTPRSRKMCKISITQKLAAQFSASSITIFFTYR